MAAIIVPQTGHSASVNGRKTKKKVRSMVKEIKIGKETIREIVEEEQYTVRPTKDDYYRGDDDTEYEVVIEHNGEEWVVFARFFPGEPEYFNKAQSKQYLKMLPKIRKAFA